MSRYIDADELRISMEDLYEHHIEMKNSIAEDVVADCLDLLDHTPTADVTEAKHGEWVYIDSDLGWEVVKCSACEKEYSVIEDEKRPNYCPKCGAKMGGENNESS